MTILVEFVDAKLSQSVENGFPIVAVFGCAASEIVIDPFRCNTKVPVPHADV